MIKILLSDITKIKADVIVNAANKSLLGGGGVDGAIHLAAGPELLKECEKLGGCKTGEAKITKAYNLPAKFIIHTVGPVFGQENGKEPKLLEDCYLNSLKLAEDYSATSIAFPCVSTGAFGYPKDKAAKIAINSIKKYFFNNRQRKIKSVIFSVIDELDYRIYKQILEKGDIDLSK
jgi:O-acetyl-ADP-ribose deacetylase